MASRGSVLMLAGAVALALALIWATRIGPPLSRSPAGFGALAPWLAANDRPAQRFTGGFNLEGDRFGLRIVPLADLNLLMRGAEDDDTPALAATERDMPLWVLTSKAETLPSLIILPKWQRDMRRTGAAHPAFRVPGEDYAVLLKQLGLSGRMHTATTRLSLVTPAGNTISLHAPHLIATKECTPLLGTGEAMLLGRCETDDLGPFWLLSDPDLLSNHGLTQGGNARTAFEIVDLILPETGEVLVDTSTSIWMVESPGAGEERPRRWEDLARYVAYPFSLLWAGFGAFVVLLLWRGFVRDAPPLAEADRNPGTGNASLIAARARLMGLAAEPRALLEDYVAARFESEAARLWGFAHRPEGPTETALLARLERRAPKLAGQLNQHLQTMRQSGVEHWSAAQMASFAQGFEDYLERARHAA